MDITVDDFRIPIATHAEFLWAQLHSAASKDRQLTEQLDQPIWGEILPGGLDAVRRAHHPAGARERCVVTSYVGNLFSWIFGDGVQVIEPSSDECDVKNDDKNLDDNCGYLSVTKPVMPQHYNFHHEEYSKAVYPRFTTHTTGAVRAGDVVELKRDILTRWKISTQKWYAYVTGRYKTPKLGLDRIKILWLYWPEDVALCMSMKYPYSNEVLT